MVNYDTMNTVCWVSKRTVTKEINYNPKLVVRFKFKFFKELELEVYLLSFESRFEDICL